MSEKEKYCHQLKISKKIQETADTISLVFEIPTALRDKFKYRAGQFVTLFLDIPTASGQLEEIRRSYSLATSPDADQDFKISIKLVANGKGSTYLIKNVKEGDALWVTPPAGQFCLTRELPEQIVFFAAGSGITPIISLIKSALNLSKNTRCHLLYQNRSENNIIFKNELASLVQQTTTGANSRFHVEHIISSATPSWPGLHGRVNAQVIRSFLNRSHVNAKTIYYLCGPEGFMHEVLAGLKEAHIDNTSIHKESFSVSTTSQKQKAVPDEAICIGDSTTENTPLEIEAIIEGETHIVKYAEGKSVLDCLLDAKLNPPYSCLDGACMACIAKVEEGLVYQTDMGILSDDNIEAKECLTCQARPASAKVKIHYESF